MLREQYDTLAGSQQLTAAAPLTHTLLISLNTPDHRRESFKEWHTTQTHQGGILGWSKSKKKKLPPLLYSGCSTACTDTPAVHDCHTARSKTPS